MKNHFPRETRNRARKPISFILSASLCLQLISSVALAELTMQFGWSVNIRPSAAISEAIGRLKKKGITSPKLLVVYYTDQFDPREIASKLHAAYPRAKVFGETSYRGVFSSDGLHIGPHGSIAVMAFQGQDFAAGVAGSELPPATETQAVVRKLSAAAERDAGGKEGDTSSLVLLAGMKGAEDSLTESLQSVFSSSTPMIGGTSSTDSFSPGTVIADNRVYKQGVALAILRLPRGVGTSYFSGFIDARKSGKVTELKGRNLIAIDGRPAQLVYKEWAEGKFEHIHPVKEDILTMETAIAPLARRITLANGQDRLIAVRPQKFMTDGSLMLGGSAQVGETLYYVEVTKEALIRRAGVAAEKALVDGRIKISEIAGGLHIYCAGASTVIGLDANGYAARMVADIAKSMHGRPFIGAFTSAEQGSIRNVGYFNGNLMSAMAVFPK